MAIFCTDAGHGERDSGAAWNGVLEKDLNLRYTLDFNAMLIKRGHRVFTTRKSDHNVPSLSTRVKLVNEHHRRAAPRFDAIISIHCNVAAFKSPQTGRYVANESARGFYGIYSRESIHGKGLAQSIANTVSRSGIEVRHNGKLSTVELGRTLAWIHKTLPPAVLLELGFMTNPEELLLLQDRDYQRKVLNAVVDGVENFLMD